jgi:LPS export ABC transporter protein LptC
MKIIDPQKIIFSLYKIFLLLLTVALISGACKNDYETIQALTTESNLPDVTGFDIEMTYTDSGILKGKITAPEVLQYNQKEEPYYEFPKGMKAIFHDPNGNETSYIQSNYAIFYTEKELWEGRYQVVGQNYGTGEKIETEQIFWDQKDNRIYSDKFTTITNADGVFTGENGFEAEGGLRNYRMKGYSGRVTVKDTPSEVETP